MSVTPAAAAVAAALVAPAEPPGADVHVLPLGAAMELSGGLGNVEAVLDAYRRLRESGVTAPVILHLPAQG